MKESAQHGNMEMETEIILGKKVTIISFPVHKLPMKFFIGVQIARLLKRQTFNMYRSMKSKRIRVVRASPDQIKFLLKLGVVPRNTHSVTLVPYQDGLEFIADHWKREPPANVVPTAENANVDPNMYVGYLEQCASISLLLLSYANDDKEKVSFKVPPAKAAPSPALEVHTSPEWVGPAKAVLPAIASPTHHLASPPLAPAPSPTHRLAADPAQKRPAYSEAYYERPVFASSAKSNIHLLLSTSSASQPVF